MSEITKAIELNRAIESATAGLTAVCETEAAAWPCPYHDGETGHETCLFLDALDGDSNGIAAVESAIASLGAVKRAAADMGLAPQPIIVRWDDVATGAINSGSGPGEWVERNIWASNDAPIAEVFAGLYPRGPHKSVTCGDACIYASWWEYRLGWKHSNRSDITELPKDVSQFIWASYAVGSNPLPHLRSIGYRAEGGPSAVTLAKDGERPVTIKPE